MFPVRFYSTTGGAEIIKDWLRSFGPEDKKILGEDLMAVQMGFPLGRPLCAPLGNGLWEVRSTLIDRREARMIFFHDAASGQLIVVHAFVKKAQKIAKRDLDLALSRKKDFSP